jgi:phosphoribosyl-AMP cyclohydrolase
MVPWMNEKAFRETLARGEVVYWSTSRNELWHKGGTSGHVQVVKEIRIDCDGDAVLLKVEQKGGAACHTGRRSCFFRRRDGEGWTELGERVFDPEQVYGS